MKNTRAKKVVWFARGGGIARCGPFPTQIRAAQALITTEGDHVEGAFVWPELEGTVVTFKPKLKPRGPGPSGLTRGDGR